MIGITNLEIYNSFFNLTKENNKFELYKQSLDSKVSFAELRDKVAKALGLSDISIEDLEYEIYGPKNNKTQRKLSTEKSQIDGLHKFVIR